MTLPDQPVVVTPPGHDLPVWEPVLRAAPQIPFRELARILAPGPERTTLIVAGAHPDDETLGLGRLAYAWARRVGPVTGVLATAGEACVDHVLPRPAGIAERRLAEWHTAVTRLGFAGRDLLSLPDGQLSEHEAALTTRLRRIAGAAADAGPVVLAAPWRRDPHPDHRAVGRAAATVAAALSLPLVEYPVWMTYWSAPASVRDTGQELLVVLHDSSADQAQHDATLAFTSQLQPLARGATAVVPAAMLEHQRRQLLLVPSALAHRLSGRPSTRSPDRG